MSPSQHQVPPSVAQFAHTLDKSQCTQLQRLCKKIAPETKEAKKLRLKDMAGKSLQILRTSLALFLLHLSTAKSEVASSFPLED